MIYPWKRQPEWLDLEPCPSCLWHCRASFQRIHRPPLPHLGLLLLAARLGTVPRHRGMLDTLGSSTRLNWPWIQPCMEGGSAAGSDKLKVTRGDLTEGEMPWRGPRARQHSLLQATPALLLHRGGFHTEYCSPGQEKWGRPGVRDPSGRLVLAHRNSSVTKLRLSCCSVSGLTWIFLPSSLQESSLLHFLGLSSFSQLHLKSLPQCSARVRSPPPAALCSPSEWC